MRECGRQCAEALCPAFAYIPDNGRCVNCASIRGLSAEYSDAISIYRYIVQPNKCSKVASNFNSRGSCRMLFGEKLLTDSSKKAFKKQCCSVDK